VGIELQRGSGSAGLAGSPELMQLTVVRTAVNVAARVQALDPRFALRELPARPLKRISESATTFAVLAQEDPP